MNKIFKCVLVILLSIILLSNLYHNTYLSILHKGNMKNGTVHISVDDTLYVFQELTENDYDSIFDHNVFATVKELHDKYEVVVSFYCYYSTNVIDGGYNLSQVTSIYAKEFSENASWMKFGFHAPDGYTYEHLDADCAVEYYRKTMEELQRITGSDECLDNVLRLDRYVANGDVVKALWQAGVEGLLIADRQTPERESYDLTETERALCYKKDWYEKDNGLFYTPTDVRLENIENDKMFYELIDDVCGEPYICVFTHETLLADESVKKYMGWIAEHTVKCGGIFGFVTGDNNGI